MPELSASQKRFMAIMSGEAAGWREAANENGEAPGLEGDPAFAVGVALHFWRSCRRGLPMPMGVMQRLERLAADGDPTCIQVRDWLRKKTARPDKGLLWIFEGGRQG